MTLHRKTRLIENSVFGAFETPHKRRLTAFQTLRKLFSNGLQTPYKRLQMLFNPLQTPRKRFANSFKRFTNPFQMLSNTLQTPSKRFANPFQTLSKRFANALQTLYKRLANAVSGCLKRRLTQIEMADKMCFPMEGHILFTCKQLKYILHISFHISENKMVKCTKKKTHKGVLFSIFLVLF